MLQLNQNSLLIQTSYLNESKLRNKFDAFMLYRKTMLRKGENAFFDRMGLHGSERETLKRCIYTYFHCIEMDILCDYDDRINPVLIVEYLQEVLHKLANLGLDCNKRYQVYEYVNQQFKEYYKHNKKKTNLYFGGMTIYMQ